MPSSRIELLEMLRERSVTFSREYNYLAALPKCIGFMGVLSRLIDSVVMFSALAMFLNIIIRNSGLISL